MKIFPHKNFEEISTITRNEDLLPSILSNKTAENGIHNFLTTFYDFAYLFCACPFRFVLAKDQTPNSNNVFAVKSCFPQKVLILYFSTLKSENPQNNFNLIDLIIFVGNLRSLLLSHISP